MTTTTGVRGLDGADRRWGPWLDGEELDLLALRVNGEEREPRFEDGRLVVEHGRYARRSTGGDAVA